MRPPVLNKRRMSRTTKVLLAFLVSSALLVFLWFSKHNVLNKEDAGSGEEVSNVLENEEAMLVNFQSDDNSFDDEQKSFPRIFCMVPAQPFGRTKFRKILDTWGKWCDGIHFMIDPKVYAEPGTEDQQPEEEVETITSTDGQFSGSIVLLNKLVRKKGNSCWSGGSEWNPKTGKNEPVYTMCRHIWEKVWRSWVYVSDHYADQYDFFFKVDDDTFFWVPTMREVILEKEWKATEHHYFGQRVFPIGPERGLIAGALVGFSRLTLKTLVNDAYKKMPHEYGDRKNFKHGRCVDRDGATEEVTTSLCAMKIGVKPEALYDETVSPRRPHMLLWMPRDMLTFSRRDNSSSWFYKHAPRDVGTLENCCSDRPVGFHFMRLDEDLQRIYDLVVDPDNKKEVESIMATQVPIWEKANPQSKMRGVFDHMPLSPSACVLEAKYFWAVKKKWHARDPRFYLPRLTK